MIDYPAIFLHSYIVQHEHINILIPDVIFSCQVPPTMKLMTNTMTSQHALLLKPCLSIILCDNKSQTNELKLYIAI